MAKYIFATGNPLIVSNNISTISYGIPPDYNIIIFTSLHIKNNL